MGYGAAATVLSCHRSSTRRSTRRSLPPCDRQLSPPCSPPLMPPLPWGHLGRAVPACPRAPFAKRLGRPRWSGSRKRYVDGYPDINRGRKTSTALPCAAPALEDVGSEADTLSYRPSFASPARSTVATFASPRSTEYCCYGIRLYCCAICIELLLRPVVLSRAVTASAAAAGYAYCRAARRAPSLAAPATPSPVCPLGRCEVRPCVHEIDLWHSRVRCASGCSLSKAHSVIGPAKPVCCCISKF